MKPTKIIFLSAGVLAVALMSGCASSQSEPDRAATPPSATPRNPMIAPVKDPRAIEEMKAMGDALSKARSMSFGVTTMKPIHGPNDQFVHVLTSASVKMQRPNKLSIVTGGDAYPQHVYFDGSVFSVDAPEAKLYTTREMTAKNIDGVLAEASTVGGVTFPFADVLLADPLTTWMAGLEGALFIGESNRGGEKLKHIALTAKDVDWEIWTDTKTHLPRIVYVKFTGEHRSPSILMEFAKWKVNDKIAASDFAFKAPKDSKKVGFVAPGENGK